MRFTRRTSGLIATAAAIAVMTTTAIAPTPAEAGLGGIDIANNDRFAPVLVGHKPCDDEQFKKALCSPDYVASIDTTLSYNSYYQGRQATEFLATIHNDSSVNGPDQLTSSLRTHGGREILAVEHVIGNSNWSVTEMLAARQNWTLTMPDGLAAGEFTTVRVYVEGWRTQSVSLDVNGSWKSDCCGTWFAHDHLEPTTDNNSAVERLNLPTTKK